MLQKLVEQLEVPFQLAYVHRSIVGGLPGRICVGVRDRQTYLRCLVEGPCHTHDPPISSSHDSENFHPHLWKRKLRLQEVE